jgi:hypothetical protein
MSIELDGWNWQAPRPGVGYEEVLSDRAMQQYEDLIMSYWGLPSESQALVAGLNRFWGPGRLPAHRWLAFVDRVVLHSSESAVAVYLKSGFAKRCSLTVYATASLWSSEDHERRVTSEPG